MRTHSLTRLAAIAVAVVLPLAACNTGKASSASSRAHDMTPVASSIATANTTTHKLYFGITLPNLPTGNPASMTALTDKESLLHHKITMVSYFQSWSGPFSTHAATNVWNSGALPMLSWDPYNPADVDHLHGNPYYQKAWTLSQILSGRYDAYIRTTAHEMAALPFPIAVRLAHEQNGFWYPWGIYTKNPAGKLVNTAAQYRAMWRHVWGIFHAAHANNVIFVWSPNQLSANQTNYGNTYPGSKYVGWLGVSAYLHNTASWSHIGPSLTTLHKLAPNKPIIVAETGIGGTVAKTGKAVSKPAGMKALLSHFATLPGLIGWVYFDLHAYRADWRFETSPGATAALRHGLQSGRYLTKVPGTP